MEELLFLIGKISPTDPFPATTQNVVLALGNKASNLLVTKGELIQNNAELVNGLKVLTHLARIRDKEQLKPISEIAEVFNQAVCILAEALDISTEVSTGAQYDKNSSESAQVWRHTGEQLTPISGDSVDIKRHLEIGQGVN